MQIPHSVRDDKWGVSLRRWILLPILTFVALLAGVDLAAPGTSTSLQETVEAIQKSRVATRILFITAHPDDESSGLLAYLSHGLGADVALLTITRGQGGQNAIGPEQDGQLGVIRTTELLGADRFYGVHQFFTRALDNGFSKSPDQMLKYWGDLPVEDMVRVIRTYRPQVVINGWGGEHAGHGQHQASGILTPRAVREAADPNAFPAQIAEGLKPWKVTLEVRPVGRVDPGSNKGMQLPAGAVPMPLLNVSPLWGESYIQMGVDGRAEHRSQGTPALFSSGIFRRPTFLVAENEKAAAGSFDPHLLDQPVTSLSSRFSQLHAQLEPVLAAVDRDLVAAEKFALSLDRSAAAKSLADAGAQVAALERSLPEAGDGEGASARWEIQGVRDRIDRALASDVALPLGTQADRHELVAGEKLSVDVILGGKPAVPVTWKLDKSCLVLPAGWSASPEPVKEPARGNRGASNNANGDANNVTNSVTNNVANKITNNEANNVANNEANDAAASSTTRFSVSIPADAKTPSSPGDAVLPFPPPLVKLALPVTVAGYEFKIETPVEASIAKTTGIETYPLELVPAVTLTVDPAQIMVPVKRETEPITLFARVRYHGTKPAKVEVGLDAPQGWNAPAQQALDFSAPGDQLIRYVVTAPPHVAPGAYPLHPYARVGDETFRTSLEPIPTLPTRDWSKPADATAHVLDLNVPEGLRVGYIAGDNDALPETLRQIGIQVDMLDEVAVAFGDLSQYDAILVGIRAYELRTDLPRMNWRLLDYAKNGGTVMVEYQRDFQWNKLLPAPFPAKMADQGLRVTDPNSPVRFLAPENPVLNTPNKITEADFQGWIQERGLYFWSTFGAPYEAVLGLKDAAEPETNGSLVYARDGEGVYIYTGLSFFRELPAGVPGAFRLFVNLISQTRHTQTR
jgi:LmbE family N-acetylglucosaminyl deacetylase